MLPEYPYMVSLDTLIWVFRNTHIRVLFDGLVCRICDFSLYRYNIPVWS